MNGNTPKADVVYAIVCDGTRREDNGKEILLGVYSGSILVTKFPSRIELCLWLHLETAGHGKVKFEIRVLDSSGKAINGANISLLVEDDGELNGSLAMNGMPLYFEKEGPIKIQWKKPGSRWKTILTKQVALRKS